MLAGRSRCRMPRLVKFRKGQTEVVVDTGSDLRSIVSQTTNLSNPEKTIIPGNPKIHRKFRSPPDNLYGDRSSRAGRSSE